MTTKQKRVIIAKQKLNRSNRNRNKLRGFTDHSMKKQQKVV